MATRNRYAEIMAQYAQSQPYSFFGYPQSYTGGYDVSQPQAYAAPATRYEEIMAQPAARMGGQGLPTDYNPEWTALSDAEKAAYYAENPGWSKFTQLGQNIFGFTWPGALQKGVVPDFVARQKLIAQGINPDDGSGAVVSNARSAAEAQARADAAAAQANADAAANVGFVQAPGEAGRGGGGGRSSDGGASNSNPGDPGRGGGGAHLAKGGYVSMQHLGGPNPAGPDDGYAALKDGEYVINDKAVKKYGIELMNAINTGKISKGKLRGLLEI